MEQELALRPSRLKILVSTAVILASFAVILLLESSLVTRYMRLLFIADAVFCLYFWIEFAAGVYSSRDRRSFVLRNGIDVLGAIPTVFALRWLRLIKLFKLLKLLRLGVGISRLWRLWTHSLSAEPAYTLGVYSCLLVSLGAAGLYLAEHGENEKIQNYGDSVWLTLATLTTVGYGDVYPVTVLGRSIGMMIAILGIGLLASFTAALAGHIVGPDKSTKES